MQIPAARGALLISLQHMFRLSFLFQPLLFQSDCMLLSLTSRLPTSPIMLKSLFDSAMEREFIELYVVIFIFFGPCRQNVDCEREAYSDR